MIDDPYFFDSGAAVELGLERQFRERLIFGDDLYGQQWGLVRDRPGRQRTAAQDRQVACQHRLSGRARGGQIEEGVLHDPVGKPAGSSIDAQLNTKPLTDVAVSW